VVGRVPANPLNLIRLVPAEGAWSSIRRLNVSAGSASSSSAQAPSPPARVGGGADRRPDFRFLRAHEIVVTATLRSTPAIEVPASVTVLSAQTLQDAGRANLEDVLGLIPNLNWPAIPPAALLPTARHRRVGAVPGSPQSLRRFFDR